MNDATISTDTPSWIRPKQDGTMNIGKNDENIYAIGHLIRTVEGELLRLFSKGRISGTIHTSIGQEICNIGIVRALTHPADVVFSNHRNHGHFIAFSGKIKELIAEILGKQSGLCNGRGGSQHLADERFHANGVQGGLTGIGVGTALAKKLKANAGISVIFIGDGTMGEGLLYESLNLASIWETPVLFVVENNKIAQTTYTKSTLGGSLKARGESFGLKSWYINDRANDFIINAEKIVLEIRESRMPGFCIIETNRMGSHSKGDDFRPEEEKDEIKNNDPLKTIGDRLPKNDREAIERENILYIRSLVESVSRDKDSFLEEKLDNIFTLEHGNNIIETQTYEKISVQKVINQTLHELLLRDPEVILLGQDLHEPNGGAFKITKGLSEKFPKRVVSTPISEAGSVGAGIGLAMTGYKPIIEIMFADFLSLCLDQLYNQATKFPSIFKSPVPLVIRAPSGGNRGYGPTHSQSPEHLFVSVPGLTVVYPSHRHNISKTLSASVLEWPYPVLFFEHKLLYLEMQDQQDYKTIHAKEDDTAIKLFPTIIRERNNADLTLITYGGTLPIVEDVASYLEEEELQVEILVPSLLSPFPKYTMMDNLINKKKVFIIEESMKNYGWGSELLANLTEFGFKGEALRIGSPPVPIPAARTLEKNILPQSDSIIQQIVNHL